MQDFVDRIAELNGVVVTDQPASWLITVPKTESLRFEITVPRAVLEWFAVAKLRGEEIWRDWADHYAIDGESREAPALEMQACIERVVVALSQGNVRVVPGSNPGEKACVEWWRNEHWEGISLAGA